MIASKNKSKPAAKVRNAPAPTLFVVTAQRAMRKAQLTAARENARFGLPMIVQAAGGNSKLKM